MRGPILNLHLIRVLSATGSTPWERMGGRDPRLQKLEGAEARVAAARPPGPGWSSPRAVRFQARPC